MQGVVTGMRKEMDGFRGYIVGNITYKQSVFEDVYLLVDVQCSTLGTLRITISNNIYIIS